MGHLTTYEVAKDEKQIWRIAQDFAFYNTDREENPDGDYHGWLTIHTNMQPFETQEDAYNYLQQICTKSYDDHAVPFYAPVEAKTNTKIQELQRRIEETLAKRSELDQKSWVGYRTSAFIGCQNCKSKINKECLRKENNLCPCCNFDLRPPSTRERLTNYVNKIRELNKRLHLEQTKVNKQTAQTIMWLVKLEIHC